MHKLRRQYLLKALRSRIAYKIKKSSLIFGSRPEFNFVFLTTSIALVLTILVLALIKFTLGKDIGLVHQGDDSSLQYWGQLGDFFGGLLNPLLSFMALIAVLHSIKIQRKELQETQLETKIANKIQAQQTSLFERQNFESVFFRLLEVHSKILDQVECQNKRGVPAFEYMANDLDSLFFKRLNENEAAMRASILKEDDALQDDYAGYRSAVNTYIKNEAVSMALVHSAESLMGAKSSGNFSLYFRNLYQLLKLIDNTRFDGSFEFEKPLRRTMRSLRLDYYHKRQYANILRAQLSEVELRVLFYNCLAQPGAGLKIYVEKYSLLKHLKNVSFTPPHYYRNVYQSIAFADYENLDDQTIRTYATKRIERNIKSFFGRD